MSIIGERPLISLTLLILILRSVRHLLGGDWLWLSQYQRHLIIARNLGTSFHLTLILTCGRQSNSVTNLRSAFSDIIQSCIFQTLLFGLLLVLFVVKQLFLAPAIIGHLQQRSSSQKISYLLSTFCVLQTSLIPSGSAFRQVVGFDISLFNIA